MPSLCSSVCKSNGCKTEIRSHKASYVWTIEDFNFHESKGDTLHTSVFSSVTNDQVKWYLRLTPNGESDAKDSISLYLFLSKLSSFEKDKKIFADITFYILNSESKEGFKKSMIPVKVFPHPVLDNNGWGYKEFIKKDTTFKNKMLSKNTLTIRCEVKFSDMCDITTSSHQCDCDLEMPECSLSENFASLFDNQTLTDVVLSANGKDYPAHKAVLAARSTVFCAMFKHSMTENEQNRVHIEDISEAVVGGMLKYIYTGKCDDLDESAAELLVAADKYDLCGLKTICAKKLIKGLSVENATNVLILADMHHHEGLKRRVIKFIVANFAQVLNTIAWQNKLSSNFKLVNEVCQAVARK